MGLSRFSVEIFLSHSAESFHRGILWCFIIFGYRKSLDKRGVSRFSVENFLTHRAEKLRTRTLQCFTSFWYRKFFASVGFVTFFCLVFFSLTVPKKL